MITCVITNFGFTMLLGLLLALSEWIGSNPRIKENSIYQFVFNFLKHMKK